MRWRVINLVKLLDPHIRRLFCFALLVLTTTIPTHASPPKALNDHQRILHYLNRAGFGARPGDVEAIEKIGLFNYIEQQLHPQNIDDSQCNQRLRPFRSLTLAATQLPSRYPYPDKLQRVMKETLLNEHVYYGTTITLLNEMQAQRLIRATYTQRQLSEVMVDFWMNHFNVYFYKAQVHGVLPLERDVIRPRALGHFRDLLGAVAHSPAMLVYLDNYISHVPNPRIKNDKGLNENYARELLELHTLGVDGGYTQQDVVEVARCFTGWTLNNDKGVYTFTFRPFWHDNGPKTVLGQTLPANGGIHDGERVLDILAHHPSTAHYLARKMCRVFISDDPPATIVDRVAQTYTRTDGDIARMLSTMFNSSEFWSPTAYRAKIKNPIRLVVSALRATNADVLNPRTLIEILKRMGMGVYLCEVPTGYIDSSDHWLSTGSLLDRLNFSMALARNQIGGVQVDVKRLLVPNQRADDANIRELIDHSLMHGEVDESTRAGLMQAVSGEKTDYAQVVGLLLGSPDFQRR